MFRSETHSGVGLSQSLEKGLKLTSKQNLRGHFASALSHIRSGVKILSEIRFHGEEPQSRHSFVRSSAIPYVPLESLEVLFCRLDFQATQVRITSTLVEYMDGLMRPSRAIHANLRIDAR